MSLVVLPHRLPCKHQRMVVSPKNPPGGRVSLVVLPHRLPCKRQRMVVNPKNPPGGRVIDAMALSLRLSTAPVVALAAGLSHTGLAS